MSIVKALRFPANARWLGGRLLRLGAPGKPPMRVATPPEFKSGVAGVWTPEELLVGALASCYELTLVAIAERRGVPLHTVEIDVAGHLERTAAGGYGFTVLELDVVIATDPGREHEVEKLALITKEHCIVGRALEVPVHVRVETRALSFLAAAASP